MASAPKKISKTRGRTVKPILKKLSHSEKNSLDLDRGWEEQQNQNLGWGGGYGGSIADYSRSARDVSFAFEGGAAFVAASGSFEEGTMAGASRKIQHQSTASNGSSRAFIHPFQQTPRTSTPPLSYANSQASFTDNGKDYAPIITEVEDGDGESRSYSLDQTRSPTSNPQYFSPRHKRHPSSLSQTSLRRPSFTSQRTSSFSDIASSATPLPRVNTVRQASSSRPAPGAITHSQSDLSVSLNPSGIESPTGSLGATLADTVASITSPASSASVAPMSPLRSSLEGFRLRSRSDMDMGSRAENIRIARRKFEERERAKEEKHDREMIRKRERKDNKEASRIEKEAAQMRKTSFGTASPEPELVRPAPVRKRTPTRLSTSDPLDGVGFSGTCVNTSSASASLRNVSSPSNLGALGPSGSRHMTNDVAGEKISFLSRDYDSVPGHTPPAFGPHVEDVRFQQSRPKRINTAKKKTLGYWHGFIMWLRTKILRLRR